jgi:hypothetical protein
VQHRTHPAEELRVDELAGALVKQRVEHEPVEPISEPEQCQANPIKLFTAVIYGFS